MTELQFKIDKNYLLMLYGYKGQLHIIDWSYLTSLF